MTKRLEQATLVDMPTVERKPKLPKLQAGHYYVEKAFTPMERLTRNREYAKALDSYAYSISRKAEYYSGNFETSTYVDKQDRKDIVASFRNISQLVQKMADTFRYDHDLDAGIAVPLPDGLTFEDVEIEGEEDA